MNYSEEWLCSGEFRALGELEASSPSFRYEWLYKGDEPTVPPRQLGRHNSEQASLVVVAV